MKFDNLFNDSAAFIGLMSAIGLFIGLIIQFFFLKNISDLLKTVREPNRRMPPGQVWLLLVGLVGSLITLPLLYLGADSTALLTLCTIASYAVSIFVVIWQFRIVYKVADSIEAEYDSRRIPIEHRPSYQTGMFMAVAHAGTLLKGVPGISFIGSIASLAYLVGWICYWVRTHKYKQEIKALPEYIEEGESLIFSDLH